jgi:HEAT repeat protein
MKITLLPVVLTLLAVSAISAQDTIPRHRPTSQEIRRHIEKWAPLKDAIREKRASVIPELLDWYDEDDRIMPHIGGTLDTSPYRGRVQDLASFGPAAIPYLTKIIEHPEKQGIRLSAALGALEQLGPSALPALPTLIGYLKRGGDSFYEIEAIQAVGAIGTKAAPALPVLLTYKNSQNKLTRFFLYKAIGSIGPAAAEAIPALLNALHSEKGEELVAAAEALEAISPGRPEIIPAFLKSIQDEDGYARERGSKNLIALESRSNEIVPGLIDILKENVRPETIVEVRGLLDHFKAAVEADRQKFIPSLIEILEGGSVPQAVATAASILDCLDPDRSLAEARRLAAGLPQARLNAAIALGVLRSRAGEAVTSLLPIAGDNEVFVAVAAIQSIVSLGPEASKAVPKLIEVSKTAESAEVKSATAAALGKIGVASPEVLKTLIGLFPELPIKDADIIPDALAALAKKRSDPLVVETLIKALKEKDERIQIGAMEALARIGKKASRAIPDLKKFAGSKGRVGDKAREAIRRIRAGN